MKTVVALLAFMTFLPPQTASAESVAFDICAESNTWTRPSSELKTIKIWNDARYKRFGKNAYEWTHPFLVVEDLKRPGVIVALTNLSGLWTVKTQWLHQCYLDQERRDTKWIDVVSLLHRVKEVQHEGNTYTVVAEPSGKGFQWLFIRRVGGNVVLRFITPEGNELERWDESAPPEQFTQTMPPDNARRVLRGR